LIAIDCEIEIRLSHIAIELNVGDALDTAHDGAYLFAFFFEQAQILALDLQRQLALGPLSPRHIIESE
jgi:hypothetical protein